MSKKGKIIITTLSLIIAALICFCGYLLYDKYVVKGNNDNLTIITGEKIKVESVDAKLIKYNNYYALYQDNGLKLYDFKTNKSQEIKLDIEVNDDVSFELLRDGFIYKDLAKNVGYYDIQKNIVMFKNMYNDITVIYPANEYHYNLNDDYKIEPVHNFLLAIKDNKSYVVDITTQKEIIRDMDLPYRLYDTYSISQFICYVETEPYDFFLTYKRKASEGEGYSDEYDFKVYNNSGELLSSANKNEIFKINPTSGTIDLYKKDKTVY